MDPTLADPMAYDPTAVVDTSGTDPAMDPTNSSGTLVGIDTTAIAAAGAQVFNAALAVGTAVAERKVMDYGARNGVVMATATPYHTHVSNIRASWCAMSMGEKVIIVLAVGALCLAALHVNVLEKAGAAAKAVTK